MTLSAGTRLGPYEILTPLGAGGMGEVYRAKDTRLAREVAIKVLPDLFANDIERLARFQREAQVLASLNHPHVAAIYGLEEVGGIRALVLELVDGETLAERLARGPLAIEEALDISGQIADGLEAAHERGIVHRDLKPANIKLTDNGQVKILDFGLAKAFANEPSSTSVSISPTITAAATQAGVVLGTAAYMSPEQARGKPVDKRSDIWAFGAVLYEMLSGERLFRGETVSDTLAAVLTGDPDWNALPAATPHAIRRVLKRCLERDQKKRLHDIADAGLEIEEGRAELSTGSNSERAPLATRRWTHLVSFLLGVVVAGLLARTVGRPPTKARPFGDRLNINLPETAPLLNDGVPVAALSPDGSRLVYLSTQGGRTILFERRLDRLEATPIPGTEGGYMPFFSPDGQWIGFGAEGSLKKIPLSGGPAVTLCPASAPRGASWGPNGTIVFAPGLEGGLYEISASGGTPRPLTRLDSARKESSHRWPQILPGGKEVIFSTLTDSGREEDREIEIFSIDTGRQRSLIRGGIYGRYAASGHLLFGRSGALMAAPFDLQRRDLTGPAVAVVNDVRMLSKETGVAFFDVSMAGDLVYIPAASAVARTLVWVDRTGKTEPVTQILKQYANPALSRDGRRLAVAVEGERDDIWICDLSRDGWTRLTFEGDNQNPLWSPDGLRLAFSSNRNGPFKIFLANADGAQPAEQVTFGSSWDYPSSFSPDGRLIAFTEEGSKDNQIGLLSLDGKPKARPFLDTPRREEMPRISPSGKWVAYASTESGRQEIYVRPFPGPGGKWPISTDGGDEPAWSPTGNEIFYRSSDKMIAVTVRTDPQFSAGKPQTLFAGRFDFGSDSVNYDVTPDGQRFIMIQQPAAAASLQVVVVRDWFQELEARLREARGQKNRAGGIGK